MTIHHVREVPVSVTDPDLLRQVQQAVEDLDTIDATRHAITLGVCPPTTDLGWVLWRRFHPDGAPGPLVWAHVTAPDDLP